MKTQTFKAGGELILRVTLSGDEQDAAAIALIASIGRGFCRRARTTNCRPLFETPDRTYELRVPVELDDTPETGPPPPPVSG